LMKGEKQKKTIFFTTSSPLLKYAEEQI
jgi:hypothetical protein